MCYRSPKAGTAPMTSDLAFLLGRTAEGDRAAFAAFYREMERPVFRFIRSRLNDPHEAADILHETFMDIWRKAGSFEGRSKVQTWVFGIAYRKTVDALRKRGRLDYPGEIPDSADDAPDAEACLAAGQQAEHLRHCLDELSGEQRLAVSLAFYEDMSYGEIAAVAEVPEGTVKSRIFHAKRALLACLSGRMGEGAR